MSYQFEDALYNLFPVSTTDTIVQVTRVERQQIYDKQGRSYDCNGFIICCEKSKLEFYLEAACPQVHRPVYTHIMDELSGHRINLKPSIDYTDHNITFVFSICDCIQKLTITCSNRTYSTKFAIVRFHTEPVDYNPEPADETDSTIDNRRTEM